MISAEKQFTGGLNMNKALENTSIFVGAYLVVMGLTYLLSSLGSADLVVQSLDGVTSPDTAVSLLPLFLHICAIIALLWISLVRGMAIGKEWIVLLPMVAFAFNFIPKLSTIPIVPSAYHLLAIVIGAACPIIATLNKAKQ